jgi:hypothetical protein
MFLDNLFYFYRALACAGKVGIYCTLDSVKMLCNKHMCSTHFSESDFTTPERVHFNRVAVPCDSDCALSSLPQAPVRSLGCLTSVIIHKDNFVLYLSAPIQRHWFPPLQHLFLSKQTFHPIPVIAKWKHMLKLYELD